MTQIISGDRLDNQPYRFFKTSPAKDGHWHLVFMREDGSYKIDGDHDHAVAEFLDPVSGKTKVVIRAGEDAHIHDKIELVRCEYEVRDDLSEDDRIKDCLSKLKAAEKICEDYLTQAAIMSEYFLNRQWKAENIAKLQAEKRPISTMNRMTPGFLVLLGIFLTNRDTVTLNPVETGSVEAGDLLGAGLRALMETTSSELHQAKIFYDQAITGRGNFKVRIDPSLSIHGDTLVTERMKCTNVLYGHHENEDLSDLEYQISSGWVPLSRAKAMFPEKKKDLDLFKSYMRGTFDATNKILGSRPLEIYEQVKQANIVPNNEDKRYWQLQDGVDYIKLYEIEQRDYGDSIIVRNVSEDVEFNASDLPGPVVARLEEDIWAEFFDIERVAIQRIRVTTFAGPVILRNNFSEFSGFSTIPVYAVFYNGEVLAPLMIAKHGQDMINKLYATIEQLINTTISGGLQVGPNSNPTEVARLEEKGTSQGMVYRRAQGEELVQPLRSGGMDSSIVNFLVSQIGVVEKSMNLQDFFIDQKDGKPKTYGLSYLFNNFRLGKRLVAKLLLEGLKQVYTPERFARFVLNHQDLKNVSLRTNSKSAEGGPAERALASYSMEDIQELYRQANVSDYAVTITESPHSETHREAALEAWKDILRSASLPQDAQQLAIEIVFELTSLPFKEKFSQRLKELRQSAQKDQKDTADKQVDASQPDPVKIAKYTAHVQQGGDPTTSPN